MARKRYPSDLSDAEWAELAPLIPAVKPGGRPALHDRREIVNALLYVAREGCTWRALPHDFPAWQTVYDYFRQWRDAGVWETVNGTLRGAVRERAGRSRHPHGAVLDSQTAKTTEKGGRAATTAPRNAMGANAMSSWIRRDC
jgi:transposase